MPTLIWHGADKFLFGCRPASTAEWMIPPRRDLVRLGEAVEHEVEVCMSQRAAASVANPPVPSSTAKRSADSMGLDRGQYSSQAKASKKTPSTAARPASSLALVTSEPRSGSRLSGSFKTPSSSVEAVPSMSVHGIAWLLHQGHIRVTASGLELPGRDTLQKWPEKSWKELGRYMQVNLPCSNNKCIS